MKKEKKISTVNDFKAELEKASLLVVSDYRGLSVERMTALRAGCRRAGAKIQVIKNTLAKKAIPGTPFAAAEEFFEGPTAVALSGADAVVVLKALTGFSKENEVFKIKGGILAGGKYSPEQLFRIATLPSRGVLLGRMVGSLNSPLARMVGTLGNPLRGLLGALHAIRKAREGN